MFGPISVSRKLDQFEQANGWRPVPHPLEEVDLWIRHFDDSSSTGPIVRDKVGNIDPRRPFTKKEKQWIANERAMCNPPDAPIWMADCTFNPIGDVKPGDEIIGWQREVRPTAKRYRNAKPMNLERLCKTRVVATARHWAHIIKITMESGRIIRCTPDHLWSSGATYRGNLKEPWQQAKVGRTLRRVVDLYPNEPNDLRAAAWLGGFYDGEGHAECFAQSREKNPEVCAQLEKYLSSLGFKYNTYHSDNTGRSGRDKRADWFYIHGGRDEYARFMAWCKPSKSWSLEKKIFRAIAAAPDRIAKIEDDGEGEVVSLQTETGNYVVWGYASKNCAIDCGYYLTRYYMISSESHDGRTGNIMHFQFRSGQRVFYKLLQQLDDKGVSKEIFCLKARKQGISTLCEGIMSWGPQFVPGVKAAVSSADGQKTQIMMGMMTFAIDELPWWLEPTKTRDQRSSDRALLEWSHIGGMVMVQPGSMRGGIGQGTTPSFSHVSEASQFTDHVVQLDEGLFKAMTSAPGNVLIIETTGDGNQWVREMWNNCKDNYYEGRARFLPVFLPWFMTPELFPSSSWIKKYPIPEGWTPAPETVEMTLKAETYVRSTRILYEELGKGWHLPPEQQWYWEFNFEEHRRRGIEKSWRRQMPVDDYEALLGDNDKAVGEEALSNMLRTVDISPRIYMVAGEGIEPKHEPPAPLILNGEDARRLYAEWTSPKGEQYQWGFIPTVGEPSSLDFNPLKHLLIYEEPSPGYDYGIGVDTGTGVDRDRSVICVTRSGGLDEPDIQVAEFADSSIGNTELYAWIAAICALYSRYMDPRSIASHPKLAIEMRRKFGDMSYHQVRLMGFRRHHDFVPLDKKTFKPVPGKNGRPGWWTNAWSRPMLLGFFTSSLENGWYEVKSRYLQKEVQEAEIRILASGQSRMDHTKNHHDDRIFAAAMSHFTLHPAEVLADWSKRRYDRGQEHRLEIDYSPAGMTINNGGEKLFGTLG